MSTPAFQIVAPQTPTRAMLVALGLVAAICGLIIVVAYEASLNSVKENRRVAMERAIHKVLPGAARTVTYVAMPNGSVTPAGGDEAPAGGIPFHAAFDTTGQLMGVAAEGSAKGYAGNVRVMFGYSPQCHCVVGFSVVSMQETPGIGDKILKDASFLANFKALDVQLAADMQSLANEVQTVKHGSKTQAWQIDAISGATVTSRAVGRAINDAAQALLPVVVPQIDKIGPSDE